MDRAMDPGVYESDMRARLLSSDAGGSGVDDVTAGVDDVDSPMNLSHMINRVP